MKYLCPICEVKEGELFLQRENVPVQQHLLFEEEEAATNIARGKLSIAICHSCGFVFNAAFDPLLLTYDEKYENTQSFSPAFEAFLDDRINYLVKEKGVRNCRVIEVGCGKGYFLQKLIERGNNSGVGFDPSYTGPLELLGGKLRFVRSFYDEKSADLVADVIICRHVIEHIAKPLDLLRVIHRTLVSSPTAQVFLETPDVKWILKGQVVWDFFYEHCSYFCPVSIKLAFESSGFLVEGIKNIFSEQYLWVEARATSESRVSSSKEEVKFLTGLAQKFVEVDTKQLLYWKEELTKMKKGGNIAIWGAGAKGVTFSNMFDPHREWISCIVDLNPLKQNKYLPGTGHPIVSYQELAQQDIKSVIILNENYRQEIEVLLKKSGMSDIQIRQLKS